VCLGLRFVLLVGCFMLVAALRCGVYVVVWFFICVVDFGSLLISFLLLLVVNLCLCGTIGLVWVARCLLSL